MSACCVASQTIFMGGCQNYGPLLRPLNTRCRIIPRTQKGTIILTTTLLLTLSLGHMLGQMESVPEETAGSQTENQYSSFSARMSPDRTCPEQLLSCYDAAKL